MAVNPWYAVNFFANNGFVDFLAMYAVFLVTTGGVVLYVDLGHFGRQPISKVWLALVLPALRLNYFGQGALLIAEPSRGINPFFSLAPSWALYPLILRATATTCIASQAVITGPIRLRGRQSSWGCCPGSRSCEHHRTPAARFTCPRSTGC